MKEKGLKGIDVARRLDLSSGVTTHWRTGISKPSAKNLQRLAEVRDCDPDYLLNGGQDQGFYISNRHKKLLKDFQQVSTENQMMIEKLISELANTS